MKNSPRSISIDQFKSHFFSGSDLTHLNSSGQCLIPDVNLKLADSWRQRFYSEGAFCAMEGWGETDVTRNKLAKFLGAKTSEVSFFTTTASALSQAALGIPLDPGSEILTWSQEYPSNFYPWRLAAERAQAKLLQVESENFQTPAKKLLERVTKKTKVIAVSWVQYQNGALTDLKALSKELKGSGIWLVADVIQGVGVRPFNFSESGFDIVCGGSHKYLCSGYGAGYMAIKEERKAEISPLEVGAMTYGDPDTIKSFTIQPKMDGFRFEPGSKAMIEIIALGATLDLLAAVGIQQIFAEATRLASRLAKGIGDLGFKIHSPEGSIVNFSVDSQTHLEKIIKVLTDNKISFAPRHPGIRLSTHAYNTDKDVDRVLEVLKP